MKRAFYIVFLLGVLLSMQSCDRIGNLIGESDTPKEQTAEVQAHESVDDASTDTLETTKIQTKNDKDCNNCRRAAFRREAEPNNGVLSKH